MMMTDLPTFFFDFIHTTWEFNTWKSIRTQLDGLEVNSSPESHGGEVNILSV